MSCARRASASGNRAAMAGLTLPLAQKLDRLRHRLAPRLLHVVVGVHGEAAHRGAALDIGAHFLEQVGLRHSAEHRVGDDHAERRGHLQAVGERLARHVVEHDVGAAAAGQREHPLHHGFGPVIDRVRRAAALREGAFFLASRGADHGRAGEPRHVDQGRADAAGRAIDHHGPGRDAAGRVMQQDPCKLIVGQRRCGVRGDIRGERPGRLLGHGGVLGIKPAAVADLVAGDEHRLPDLERRHARPERRDRAAHLVAEHERQLRHPAVAPGADHGVEIIDADGGRLHQHLAGTGRGRRQIDRIENVAAAGAADLDRLHGRTFERRIFAR